MASNRPNPHGRCTLLPKCRRVGVTAIFIMAAAVMLAACGGVPAGPPAPDFQVTRFDGTEFKLSDQAGRHAMVINFWYPSCPPCRAEMPDFEKAWQQLSDEGVRFLGVFVPQGFDTEQDARDFVDELRLTYWFATDEGALVAQTYELEYFPMTFFIDEAGRIFKELISALDEDKIVSIVREMIQD